MKRNHSLLVLISLGYLAKVKNINYLPRLGPISRNSHTRLETLIYIHKLLPYAQYISSYPTQILIECFELPDNEFGKLIESAPSHLGELFVGYMNGELIKECHERVAEHQL